MNDSTQQQTTKSDDNNTYMTIDGQQVQVVGGVACPVDPFEREMCDSCQ
jgi:hypothetical protein